MITDVLEADAKGIVRDMAEDCCDDDGQKTTLLSYLSERPKLVSSDKNN